MAKVASKGMKTLIETTPINFQEAPKFSQKLIYEIPKILFRRRLFQRTKISEPDQCLTQIPEIKFNNPTPTTYQSTPTQSTSNRPHHPQPPESRSCEQLQSEALHSDK